MKSTSFNFSTFPQLQADISEIKDILRDVFKKPMEDIPKAFNTNQAIEYIRNKGVPMSRSRLYKLSSGNKDFPVHYIGGRLLFYSQEIDTW